MNFRFSLRLDRLIMDSCILYSHKHGRYNVKFFLSYSDLFYLLVVGVRIRFVCAWPHSVTQTYEHNRQDSSGWGIVPLQRLIWQNITFTSDILVSGDIRTHSPSKRAASNLRLRPHGHPVRLTWYLVAVASCFRKRSIYREPGLCSVVQVI